MCALAGAGTVHYRLWKRRLLRRLRRDSRMVDLPCGPVEYAFMGDGRKVLLIAHGGGSGFDNIYMYSFLLEEGISLLCPSQPGCLRTPIEAGRTFEAQADMMAQLLDGLGLPRKVAVLGISLGGPCALQFALRHPEKTACLIMQDAVSLKYVPSQAAKDSFIGKVFLSKYGRDILGWLLHLSARLWPAQTMLQFLSVVSVRDRATCKVIAERLMKDPAERRRLLQFLDSTAPMSLRQTGMDHQLTLAADMRKLPIERIECPTLVTHGVDDADVPFAHGAFTAKTVQDAELHKIEGFGHLFPFGEEGKRVNSILSEFLGRNLP